eukprot:scaffold5292_cov113-Isochrysis_galbana.AAC.15
MSAVAVPEPNPLLTAAHGGQRKRQSRAGQAGDIAGGCSVQAKHSLTLESCAEVAQAGRIDAALAFQASLHGRAAPR